MGKQILYIMMFISAFWIVCEIPEPPPSAENVSLGLGFERSNGEIIKGTSLEDTTDNLIKICMYLNFTELLDSVNLRIISKTDTQKYAIDSFTQQFDTVYHSLSFSKTGNYQVNLTAYVEGKPIAVNGTITIVDRPQTAQNHAPVLTVPSSQIIGAGQTLIFTVSATDPDTNQLVTITAPKKPNTAIFKADTFKWTPTIEDTGTDTVIFIASDNYLPAKTDTEFVVINISSVRVNQSPKWSTKKIQKTIIPGELFSYELGDKCYDPDNDTLIYSIASGLPAKDTIINNIYSYTPSEADTGEYTVYITTQDPSGLEDTLTLELTVIINSVIDTIAPVFTWVSPAKDSTEISSSTIQVTVTCNDESGIDSVKCFLGTTMFNVVKSGDSTYSATVTGLLPTEWNTITFVATDASPAKNLCTLLVHLKYDNTAPSFKLSIAAGTGGKITVPVNSPVDVNYGVAKTITAAPDSGYQFVNWTITPDTAGTIASDTSASTTVTIVNANASVKANFAPITYELTMANDGNGTTTPAEGKSTVKQGAATTISAIPNPGYEFSHWTITPASAGTITSSNSASASVKLKSSNATVKAIFKIKTYSISITADNGSITLSPEQNQYDSGTVVSLKAVPVTGYEFTGWSGALTGNTNPTTIKMDGPKSITANFTIKKYSLSVAGLNGTVTKEPNLTLYDSGSTVILTAVAATGYQFSSWSGGLTGSTNPAFIKMNESKTVTANFSKTYSVTYHPNGGGLPWGHGSSGTTPVDPNQYAPGNTVTVLGNTGALTKTAYVFDGWSLTPGGAKETSFTMGSSNVTLYARWVIKDICGNTYTEVTIGNQVWLVENLKTTRYNDSTSIPVMPAVPHEFLQEPGYYNSNGDVYYSGLSVETGLLAPKGWHVPTEAEWDELTASVNNSAKALASKGLPPKTWYIGTGTEVGANPGTNNSSGFNAVPNGFYFNGIQYDHAKAYFWTNMFGSMGGMTHGSSYIISYDSEIPYHDDARGDWGLSVRCIRDF